MKRERAETAQESILNLPSICLPGWNIAGETFQTFPVPSLPLSLSLFSSNRQTVLLRRYFFYDIFTLPSIPDFPNSLKSSTSFFLKLNLSLS